MDALSIVTDEVALEGLDGITIPSLWIRLKNAQPKFPLKLDSYTKEFIWKSLVNNTELSFYELPQEREDVKILDRFRGIDPETGTDTRDLSPDELKDVYPIHVIPENKDGIQGSCVFFKERKDITKQIRSKSLTPLVGMEEALQKYGQKLVVVASQALRFQTLIGIESDPDLKLSSDSYCVLERVGRARWQGELQRDLHGGLFKVDARKFHYLRKSLVKHELVTTQPYIRRPKAGQQQHTILLLLKRFHANRRGMYEVLMEQVSNFLKQVPCHFTTVDILREHLNLNDIVFKRLCKHMRASNLTEFFQYPLEDLDPSAGPCTNKNVLSSGTKGIPQRAISQKMNVGKLESRMIWRKLERTGFIKGFMEDEGRQRTTKFISHRCVGVSDQLQLVAKEQERKKQLSSSAPEISEADPGTSNTPPSSKLPANKKSKTPADKMSQKSGVDENKQKEMCDDGGEDQGSGDKKGKGKSRAQRKASTEGANESTEQPEAVVPTTQPPPAECETPACSGLETSAASESGDVPAPDQAVVKEQELSNSPRSSPLPPSEGLDRTDSPTDNNIVVVDSAFHPQRCHETYRHLKRKNLIVEAVQKFKIIDGLFPLQKIIGEEEKQDGFSSKCCKKTILRLVHTLSKEGLLKMYTTTVIQDGITKKVDMVVHPSIEPSDERVTQLIEQVRFKISSSYSAVRQQQAEEKAREQRNDLKSCMSQRSRGLKKNGDDEDDIDFKPTPVRGLGKILGFQPKMCRLRVVHGFLWYLIYGHPLQGKFTDPASQMPTDPNSPSCDATHPDGQERQDPSDKESSNVSNLVEASAYEEELLNDKSKPGLSEPDIKVYADEDTWKRFVPPVRVHKDFTSGWAMVGDLLLCLPLSTFMQFTQINYKVDELEDYLNDPVKQHYLVRALPWKMKRQLLYKRKYIHSFHENLQKLAYMGLLQFGVVEKFKEKDQVFVYLKRNATIVDTTNTEPHYWLVSESPDQPFERRKYTFDTAKDVETYWFDLMCVCLNTPLGIIRNKRYLTDDEVPSFVHEPTVFAGMAHMLKGSYEVCDDGSIPGDGKGAGGLDSEFFGHLKRNWYWTNHLLACKTRPADPETPQAKVRLKSLLGRNALRIALQAGESTSPRYLTNKRSLMAEKVQVGVEPASRNQQVVGGKGQKRKRSKREVVRSSRRKRKEPKKRTPAHDEADHRALKMMTKQRVCWSVQEDSLMMLCSIASYMLNSKLPRPFIPHCVVRDLLHAEYEISVDKTSLSVGRRSRYILKNPQTLLNYRICLAEVYQDKALIKLLEEKKPADPNKAEDCANTFSEYVRLLRQKFSSVLTTHDVNMLDSKQELFSRYKVCVIDNGREATWKDTLNSTDDIHTIVLHNLIQSTLAMTNNQMKSSTSFQTFHTYCRYDQELLCKVFIQCRRKRLVNRRRVNQSFGPKKNRALPILPMSFQLSQSYYRVFSWRFPLSLCTDSFRFLRSLITNGTGDERPVTTFYHETGIRSQKDGLMLREEKKESVRKEKKNGKKEDGRQGGELQMQPEAPNIHPTKEGENIQSERAGEEKSMESKANDDKTEERSTSEQRKNPEYSLTSESNEASVEDQPNEEPTEAPATSATASRASEDPPDVSDMLQFSLNHPGGACAASLSLMTLGLLNVFISIPKQIVVVDSSLVDNDVAKSMAALEEDDDDDDGVECEGKKRVQVTSHQASHTNYLIMRGYSSPGIMKMRNLSNNDNIVLESCIMSLQLRSTPAHQVFSEDNSPPLELTKCGPSLLPPTLTCYIRSPCSPPLSVEECDGLLMQQKGYTARDVEACARLRRSLDEAGESGLDEQRLHVAHSDLLEPQPGHTGTLQQYLKDLQEEGHVVRVGSLGVRWVLMRHAEPWLLTVSPKQSSRSYPTSGKSPFLKSRHNIPFMRKRNSREASRGTEEPPAKKPAEGAGVEGASGSSGNLTETLNEEELRVEPKERNDEENKSERLNSQEEGSVRTQPEKEGEGEVQGETDQRQHQKRELRPRKSSTDEERHAEACSPPTASADEEESLSFISRPWRLVDGKLNRPVCKGMLEALLCHVMSRPGLTQQSLVEHYKDVLQPVAVLDLMQVLLDLGCVTKKTLVKDPKPSLFSRWEQKSRGETAVKVEQPDTVFYEPTISGCLRLCQVLPNERHWNDFIP
ncbi:unnamed protein product [Menidia menidia]|uniref:(Atlantic silverside) hypothetical protein n=1 Tax=Menidia menidia TaxID=238744 RepID=A0A8S4B395_9TELE|nr:unnamed protein product [Menidia menidia]